MKIDRLIGIIAVLQQNKKVTAPYLAKRFEVSRRTINRDIEDICRAGIPIVTTQGKGGGISIMEGFNLNTAVFTTEELQAIFAGLKSIDSVSRISYVNRLAGKIAGEGSVVPLPDNILIDLSSHYKDSLASKIELLRKAISQKRLVRFHYYYSKGEADKLIEPYLIVFKWSNWYVFGFCTEQQDFRMYKLNRLWDLIVTETGFVPREIPEQQKDFDSHMTDNYIITAVFDNCPEYSKQIWINMTRCCHVLCVIVIKTPIKEVDIWLLKTMTILWLLFWMRAFPWAEETVRGFFL